MLNFYSSPSYPSEEILFRMLSLLDIKGMTLP